MQQMLAAVIGCINKRLLHASGRQAVRRWPAVCATLQCRACHRDKRALGQQVQQLQQALDAAQAQHTQELAVRDVQHVAQLGAIRDSLQQRQQEWVRATTVGWGLLLAAACSCRCRCACSWSAATLPDRQWCRPAPPLAHAQETERQALQERHGMLLADVEQWSQGEVEAVQAAAAARLRQEQDAAAHW